MRGYSKRRPRSRFPEIGRIRKGASKKDTPKGEFPADLTYFRIDYDETDPNFEETRETVLEHYGPMPKALHVMLPFDKVEDNFDGFREAYRASGMIFQGDFFPDESNQYRVWYRVNLQTGEKEVVGGVPVEFYDPSKPIGLNDKREEIYAEPRGRLRVILTALNRLAFFTAVTGSAYDVSFLDEQLGGIETFHGSLRAVPLIFRRTPVMISTPSGPDGKRAKREKWLLNIEADPTWVKQRLLQSRLESLPQLKAPVDAEFYELPAPMTPQDETETLEELNGGEVVEGQVTENGAPKFESKLQEYWWLVYEVANIGREKGLQILEQTKKDGRNDYVAAIAKVKEGMNDDVPF